MMPSTFFIRRAFSTAIILVILWWQLAANMGPNLPDAAEIVRRKPQVSRPIISLYANFFQHRVGWTYFFGWYFGFSNYWRMFSPVDIYNWRFKAEGLKDDGTSVDIPMTGQGERDFWDRNFFDFREYKLELNLMGLQGGFLEAFADYLCIQQMRRGEPIERIKFSQVRRRINKLEQVAAGAPKIEPGTEDVFIAEAKCSPSIRS